VTSELKAVLALARRSGAAFERLVAADAQTRSNLSRELAGVAADLESKHLDRIVVDVIDIYSAAQQYCNAIDDLVARKSASARRAAAIVAKIQVLLYDEVSKHLRHLKRPLAQLATELYRRSEGTQTQRRKKAK